MAKLFRKGQSIKVLIDDAVFSIVPLTLAQKHEITKKLDGAQKGGIEAVGPMLEATKFAIKYSIKGLEGVTDGADEPYALEFGSDGFLTDDCVEDLSNFEASDKLTQVLMGMLAKFGSQPEGLEGVTVNYVEKQSKTKK